MKYRWEDLPSRLNLFTVRSAVQRNMDSGKIVQNYSANTRITVVQKCVTPEKTYYRTETAKREHLNWAFEASAFGLPNEEAPSVPDSTPLKESPTHSQTCGDKKQKSTRRSKSPKDGARAKTKKSLFKRLFRL